MHRIKRKEEIIRSCFAAFSFSHRIIIFKNNPKTIVFDTGIWETQGLVRAMAMSISQESVLAHFH